MWKNFLRNKKTCAHLNFLTSDGIFLYVVNSFMAYNLQKFQIGNIKIEAWATHKTENFFFRFSCVRLLANR